MSIGLVVFCLALIFTSALSGFVFKARQKGWRHGEVFSSGKIPTLVSLGCVAALVGKLVFETSAGNFSYLWFLYAAIVYFIGGSVALALMGRWGGMISMIAAPAFAVATVFFKL